MAMIEDQDTINAFIEESKEHLEGIEDDLLAIEEAGAAIDSERVNKVFRAVHSIKGGAGFLGLDKVKELAHSSENVMGKVRDRVLIPTPDNISILLESIDLLSNLIDNHQESNKADISRQLEALNAIYQGENYSKYARKENPGAISSDNLPESIINDAGKPLSEPFMKVDKNTLETSLKKGQHIFILEFDLITDIEDKGKTCAVFLEDLKVVGEVLAANVDYKAANIEEQVKNAQGALILLFGTIMEKDLLAGFFDLKSEEMQQISPDELKIIAAAAEKDKSFKSDNSAKEGLSEKVISKPPVEKAAEENAAAASASKVMPETTLRVNVKLLDKLMTLAGELVLTRNQFLLAVNSRNCEGFNHGMENISQRLNLVTSELQEAIMSTRMQPVGNVFNKFKRVVRDLSKKLGKKTNLIIKGEEVELDKTIIESIGDPLTHLVRNSVDHGFEMPEERVEKGKSATGTLRITAFHEGGQVMITIEDDGAGINTEKIKEKALAMGVYDAAALEAMSNNEVAKIIFLPGMSTASQVSDLSGRGVGMDVVNTNISKVGGTVDVETTLGKGTLITIKLPLTLAIIPSLIVTVNDERFAIPQVNMVELVRIPAAKVKERVERVGKALVMRLRGELLPLVKLSDALGVPEKFYVDNHQGMQQIDRRLLTEDRRSLTTKQGKNGERNSALEDKREQPEDRRSSPKSAYNILVVSAGDYHYGLIVDQLLDSEEIVVKPLGYHLRDSNCYAGASIQGDGKVALILDIVGISNIMNLRTVSKSVQEHVSMIAEESRIMENYQSLLIVRNSPDEQMAIPLDLVSRIEKSLTKDIEITGGRRNIQYRGGTLPLFSLDEVTKVSSPNTDESSFYIIVFTVGGKEVGLIMSDIVDIVRGNFDIDAVTHHQPGIMGSTIIMDEITLLIDLYGVTTVLMPDWVEKIKASAASVAPANILVVEDSPFFMNQLLAFLKEAGHATFSATDGVEALKVLEQQKIDLVMTDIEMPNMDGLELTEEIRANPRLKDLPVVAVTSIAGEEAEMKGKEAGINDYLIKLDREKIISTLSKYLTS